MSGGTPGPRNMAGGVWLIADMALNIWALTIVKALGLGYPAAQLVFLRACVGLVVMAPWIWRQRTAFRGVDRWRLHGARVVASTLALSFGFYAIARLPFALVTAISFTRPVVTMILAVLFLNEAVARRRWIAAGLAFLGVMIAVEPGAVALSWALLAMAGAVLCGTTAIILTRRLAGTPTVVMMTFYTGGLTLLTLPLAWLTWAPITASHLVPLLAIGALAQVAQYCFLQAHSRAEAGFLAILGYLSLLLTTGVGYVVFDEVPSLAFGLGAALIVAATLWTTLAGERATALSNSGAAAHNARGRAKTR